MLLSLLPFPEESFLLRRKTLAGLFSAILVAAAAIFSLLVWLADAPGRPVTPTGMLSVSANFFMGAVLRPYRRQIRGRCRVPVSKPPVLHPNQPGASCF